MVGTVGISIKGGRTVTKQIAVGVSCYQVVLWGRVFIGGN